MRSASSRLLLLAFLFAACGGDRHQKALGTSLAALNAASAGFVEYDKLHQRRIVDDLATSFEDGKKRLAEYREARERVVGAFALAYAALAAAAIEPKLENLQTALRLARDVYDEIEALRKGEP